MSTTLNDRLQVLLEPLASEAGVDLEEVTLTKVGGRRVLDVVLDADGGVDLDTVAELSRAFGVALDGPEGTAVLGDGEYRLEVGSPGTDRLLTLPRHWRRARTRLVKAQLTAGAEVTGRITESDEDGVLLEIAPVKGRGRATERRLAYTEIAKARVQIEFNRKGLDDDADLDTDVDADLDADLGEDDAEEA
ncbi:ribosome maturation factor RimP [Streptacidiphilus carbonis]|uniref:ribosome maturation factor RimP n=1 Tax=Streptacidiphilus carbonis TaxID=105422 RepID=UPI0005AA619F|nr:ribosome maturation factor RimP [Streptacidiphilus carbonis]